jgi:hypothetical protein
MGIIFLQTGKHWLVNLRKGLHTYRGEFFNGGQGAKRYRLTLEQRKVVFRYFPGCISQQYGFKH